MSDSSLIIDPSARFIDEQQEDLVDFMFRLTADRSRAAVMGREACRQMKDELSSQLDHANIRTRLFQLAYELNEDALRPIARNFFEAWYRHQHQDQRTVAASFRWEFRLLEMGHHASQLLVLRHRYGFSPVSCAEIMNREVEDINHELEMLENLVKQDKGLDLAWLKELPHYGFLDSQETMQQTALSHIMGHLRPRERWWGQWALLSAFLMFFGFLWLLHTYAGFSNIWRLFRLWMVGS